MIISKISLVASARSKVMEGESLIEFEGVNWDLEDFLTLNGQRVDFIFEIIPIFGVISMKKNEKQAYVTFGGFIILFCARPIRYHIEFQYESHF